MSAYIDKRKIIEALSIFNDKEHGNPHFLNGIKTAIEVVENFSEEIVQCKDCIYSQQFTVPTLATGICHCDYFMRSVGDGYGFCKWGCKYSNKEGKEITNEQIY